MTYNIQMTGIIKQDRKENVKPSTIRPQKEEPFVEPFPAPPIVSPKEELYSLALERPLVRLITTEGFELLPVAVVEVNPVRILKNGSLEFYPEIDISLKYESMNSGHMLGKDIDRDNHTISLDLTTINSRTQAKRMIELARSQVVNPHAIFDCSKFFLDLTTNIDYLIITDNHSWDKNLIKPKSNLHGDLVSIFQRLADWKEKRGVKAKVITVSDIVNGTYGNFATGARDLQEVIRNFLKSAYKRWGVSWLLLGGDVDILPVRVVAGSILGGIELKDDDPPLNNKSFWTGSFLKMNVINPGDWWPGSSADHLLIRFDTGLTY
ncbi:MAG TPA: C25 family cysteine peptidase [Nitrososphaeraceae archaeon]|nr:C25 family cysteine peptidase [Nitrososphaeraceae archaeon]